MKRERDAFELFKDAYKVGFPGGGPTVPTELDLLAPQLAAEADAEAARAAVLFVALDTTFFAAVEEGRFAEIEWL
ncbi:MAG TPA: hypothetical protein VF621_02055 [Pyrinomonadaceae bacterium]